MKVHDVLCLYCFSDHDPCTGGIVYAMGIAGSEYCAGDHCHAPGFGGQVVSLSILYKDSIIISKALSP
jgi:hypothetical protein